MGTVLELLNDLASKGVKLSAEAGQLNCYAQKGALTEDIREGIAKYRSEIIALFENRKQKQAAQTGQDMGKGLKEFPLSVGQKGLYYLQSLHPEMSSYNVPMCCRFKSPIDMEILRRAWG